MTKDKLHIRKRLIGTKCPVFIIAEAGVNHNGNLKLAMKMVAAAKEAGADAIKFQTYKTEELVSQDAPLAKYQKANTKKKNQYEMLKALELSEKEFLILSKYCRKKNILFLSSPFDLKSAEYLNKLDIPAYKISSGELTNTPLLLQVARHKKPIILSTGMANINEIREAIKCIYSTGNRQLILLHCTSSYPTRYEDVNLKAIVTMSKEFNLPVGYSDHTEGELVSLGAVALGACVIEKHFTLSRKMAGPDHKASLEVVELKTMISDIRNMEKALGDGRKNPAKVENELKIIARKSIITAVRIEKGEIILPQMLAIKRPGLGLAPKYFNACLGRKAKRHLNKNTLLKWNDLI